MNELGRRSKRIAEEKAARKEKNSKKRAAFEWIRDIVIAVMVALVVINFVTPTFVEGNSMEPNLHDGDYLIMSRQSYKLLGGEPEYGDIVVVRSSLEDEDGEEKLIIKRIIGLPGDEITIENGKVYVNGVEQDDSYTKDGVTDGAIEGLIVPDDSVFCLGDNRLNSKDSRSPSVGCIPMNDILGKVVFRILPISDFGFIYNPYDDE